MLLVVTPSVEGDVKKAGMTRADAMEANIKAITIVMRILTVVCEVECVRFRKLVYELRGMLTRTSYNEWLCGMELGFGRSESLYWIGVLL